MTMANRYVSISVKVLALALAYGSLYMATDTASMQRIEFEGTVHEFPADFSDEEISTALAGGEPDGDTQIYYGDEAIAQVESKEGKLDEGQRHLVELEGYSTGKYKDTKGNDTTGVGQTSQFADMPFKQVYEIHVERAKSRVKEFDSLPSYVQRELIQAEYRGDLANSPEFLRKLNAGDYAAAAAEFIDNDEYRDSLASGNGVAKRMRLVRDALLRLAAEQSQQEG